MKREAALLVDIVEHARLVRDRVSGLSRQAFDNDRVTQLGIAHALQIIGEAARLLPESARINFPSVPWKQIVGMRHRLVHEYFRVDFDRVWDTAVGDIPTLLAALEPTVGPLADQRPPLGTAEEP
jgi:uncharacterized protein with HEPN domain